MTVDALEKANVRKAILEAREGKSVLKNDLFEALKLELENVMASNVYSEFCKNVRRKGSIDFASTSKAESKPLSQGEMDNLRRKGADLVENLVIEPDNYSVLYALCQVYTINESHEEEERSFLSGVVEILLEHSSLFTFLSYVIKREVTECLDVNTLFRGRTVFTLLLADLFRRRPCVKFLADCTKNTLADAQKLKTSLEVDVTRVDVSSAGGSANVEREAVRNAERLIKMADGLMERIRKRYSKCPPSLRKVFELLSHVTQSKFPLLQWKIVGAVFFLRFINPALSQPELHSLVSREIPMHQRKALVVVSKMIQFVTNDSRFDESNGNAGHVLLNQWIAGQINTVGTLFSQLIEVSESDWSDQTDIKSPKHDSNGNSPRVSFSSKTLASMMNESKEKIKSRLDKSLNLGEHLNPEQSMALRLRVLDTLIKNQAQVKDLLSANMSTMTQWVWLKEALSSLSALHSSSSKPI